MTATSAPTPATSPPPLSPRWRRLRIAHVTATFPPYWGGTGNVCYHNALELARRGHEVTVFTVAHPPGHYDFPSELRVRRLPALFRVGNAPFLPRLPFLFANFDLVHLHYPFYLGAELTWLACRYHRIPYIITYHQDVEFAGPLNAVPALHHRSVGLKLLRDARRLLFTSLDYARSGKMADYVAGHPGQVGELPNGVDLQMFCPGLPSEDLRARHGIPAGSPTALFVGALDKPHYFKGVEVLLRAFAALTDPRARLVIVGDGDLRQHYQAQAHTLGIGGRVTFAGRVSPEELPRYYNMAQVAVLPSTTRGEAFGMVLIEAMACGIPVIASRLAGVRSVVEESVDGFLAEPGDVPTLTAKLAVMLADPDRCAQMGAAGRRKVQERYGWGSVGARLESIYLSVTGNAQHGSPS